MESKGYSLRETLALDEPAAAARAAMTKTVQSLRAQLAKLAPALEAGAGAGDKSGRESVHREAGKLRSLQLLVLHLGLLLLSGNGQEAQEAASMITVCDWLLSHAWLACSPTVDFSGCRS